MVSSAASNTQSPDSALLIKGHERFGTFALLCLKARLILSRWLA